MKLENTFTRNKFDCNLKIEKVEAIQVLGDNDKEVLEFCPDATDPIAKDCRIHVWDNRNGVVNTAYLRDFIVKGCYGNYFPVTESEFYEDYELFKS
jgi:hypothetical protein